MAKVLLTESPAHLFHQMARGRMATRAMEAGSLFDYLVFDLDSKYEVVDARYRTGRRAGQPVTDWQGKYAQEMRDEIRRAGKLPVLQDEVDGMTHKAERARLRIRELLGDGRMVVQRKVQWRSEAAGFELECEGTPDLVYLYPETRIYSTADLKNVASVHPRKMARQIYEMCWDVQAAAYEEAAAELSRDEFFANDPADPDDCSEPWTYGGHTIIACESGGMEQIRCYPLDPVYLAVGRRRWAKAQRQYKECLDSNDWPGYPENPLGPSLYVTRTELETYEDVEEEP